jgi:uncharacterized protein with PQ loop repeat
MEAATFQIMAGSLSSLIFAAGAMPMLIKARRTHDMSSYSFAYLVLMNIGNGIYWLYIISLPWGPIWFMHLFWTATMLLMLVWYLRYQPRATRIDLSQRSMC